MNTAMRATPIRKLKDYKKQNRSPNTAKLATRVQTNTHASVIAVGDKVIVNEIAKELKHFGITTKKAYYIKDLKKMFRGNEMGIIYAAPLLKSEIQTVHKNLTSQTKFREVPFFAVLPEYTSGRRERLLYKTGIRMIFEWPREKRAFSDLLSGSIFNGLNKVKSEDTDDALKKAIKNRISSFYPLTPPKIGLYTYKGMALVRGEMPSIAEKRKLVKMIKKVPGVRGVVDSSLKVSKKVIPMGTKKEINQSFTASPKIPGKTLEVKINKKSQEIELFGTAPDQKTVQTAKKKLEKLSGITSIKTRVVVSQKMYDRDLALARKAQRIVNKMCVGRSKNQVTVKVTSKIAIIKGKVTTPTLRNHIKKAIMAIEGIKQIDNQIELL